MDSVQDDNGKLIAAHRLKLFLRLKSGELRTLAARARDEDLSTVVVEMKRFVDRLDKELLRWRRRSGRGGELGA